MEVEHSGDEHSSILKEEQQLEHFSHEKHPLTLIKEMKYEHDDMKVHGCNGCALPIFSGSMYYSCSSQCEYNLHKLCAELPKKMKHPKHPQHPQHPLNLAVQRQYCRCSICGCRCKNFTYYCYLCKFHVDILCASLMERKFKHPSHEHPLNLMRTKAVFRCHACQTKHQKGFSYFCTTCFFWIHQDCASLPSTLNRTDIHRHPLDLAYSLPSQYDFTFRHDYNHCDICLKIIKNNQWVYHCLPCRYLAHVNCATSKTEPFMSILLPRLTKTDGNMKVEDPDPNTFHLPPSDGLLVGLISHFIKLMSQGENERAAEELNHFSHHHALSLFDVESNKDASCSDIKLSLVYDTKNDEILCKGCVKPISVPFYKCKTGCNYFLHKCCAELPCEVPRPCHPEHPLVLLPKSPEFFGVFRCHLCGRYSNGFAYGCNHCKFYIDVICASLPSTVKHESHPDHLLVFKDYIADRCKSCSLGGRVGFSCDTCSFNLDTSCAILPRTVQHRYDEHPFTRTCSLVHDQGFPDDEYYCEVCEEELDPKKWFYHCGDCKQSMDADCVRQFQGISNIEFGGTLNIKSHPHALTSVPANIGNNYKCNRCGHDARSQNCIFECSQCKYVLCFLCAKCCSKESS